MKHEFIVTLDGLEGGQRLSIQTGTHARSLNKTSKCRSVGNKHKSCSRSFTLSDEEFEEIMHKKDVKEKKHVEEEHHRSRVKREKNVTHKYDKSSLVDQEILLAEKKLKAQKLLRKSLEQVQSINVIQNVKPKTAFINPHFHPVQLAGPGVSTPMSVYPSLNPAVSLSTVVLSPTECQVAVTDTSNHTNETEDTGMLSSASINISHTIYNNHCLLISNMF